MPTTWAGANLFILTTTEIRTFRRRLRAWYQAAKRDLPWRRTRDPWRVLVSEVMLQQTRVATVIPYYERFLAEFPTAAALADAPEARLLSMWSGLGYYSRARNLQKAARQIGSEFPSTFEGIRDLAGVGDYTAAAVASIAFDLPHAVLDGNVARVLARLTAEEGDIKSAAVKTRLSALASRLLDPKAPGDHNQAVMELGATLCLPRDPQCLLCPVSPQCAARRDNRQHELPVRAARREPVRIERTILVIRQNGSLLMRQRPREARLMPGFWELPEVTDLPAARKGAVAGEFRHTITHHLFRFDVVEARIASAPFGFDWVAVESLGHLPLATTAKKALLLCGVRPDAVIMFETRMP